MAVSQNLKNQLLKYFKYVPKLDDASDCFEIAHTYA